jgi:hypothetical protein
MLGAGGAGGGGGGGCIAGALGALEVAPPEVAPPDSCAVAAKVNANSEAPASATILIFMSETPANTVGRRGNPADSCGA